MKSYATIHQVTPGTRLIADGGFTCMKEGEIKIVENGPNGLFVRCQQKSHCLDGQLNDEDEYIGFYLEEENV